VAFVIEDVFKASTRKAHSPQSTIIHLQDAPPMTAGSDLERHGALGTVLAGCVPAGAHTLSTIGSVHAWMVHFLVHTRSCALVGDPSGCMRTRHPWSRNGLSGCAWGLGATCLMECRVWVR